MRRSVAEPAPPRPCPQGQAADRRLTLREKIGYGCGDLSSNLLWGITGSFIMYYYTDVYRIPATQVALLLVGVRIFDAGFDPLVGWLIDRSRDASMVTRLIKWLAVPFGVISLLAFLPLPLAEHGRLAWACLTYGALGAIYAGINTPYSILAGLMTDRPQQRVVLNAWRMIGSQCGLLIVSFFTLPAVHWLGGGSSSAAELRGFPLFMAGLGLLGSLMWWATLYGCRVRHPPVVHTYPLKALLSALLANRGWLLASAAFALSFINIGAFSGFALYYSRSVLRQSTEFGGLILTLVNLCTLAGNVCAPWLCRYLHSRTLLLASYLLQMVILVFIALLPAARLTFLPLFGLVSLLQGFTSPVYYALVADSIDRGMSETGVRAAGLAWALNTLMTKIAFALAGALLALLLAAGHYQPAAQVQSLQTARYVTAGFIWLPAIVCLLSLPLLWRLPHNEPKNSNTDSARGVGQRD